MKNLTAIVVSFMRPEYTIGCVKSLRRNYPNIKIMVGEQIKDKPSRGVVKVCEKYGATYVELPFDCGVGASRNKLIELVDTEYVLVGDDDFLYDERAKVDQMLEFLKNTDFDVIGGRIIQDAKVRNYQGFIKIKSKFIRTDPIKNPDSITKREEKSGLRFEKCDLIFNYFVARKRILEKYKWDENIKVAYEHHHFFVNLKKKKAKVAFSPDPLVLHKFQNYPVTNEYRFYRMRRQDKEYYFKSLGIDYSITISGVRDSL